MRQYYLVKVTYKDIESFLIWYSDDEDGLLLLDDNLLIFKNIDEAMSFAKNQNFLLEMDENKFDFSDVFELLKGIEFSENCSKLINIWNFFSDLAKSLNMEFVGDSDDDVVTDIYSQLFHGINIKVLKNEEYHPILDDEEKQKCVSIFRNGLSLLDNQYKKWLSSQQ